jgi:hypothetical protein
MYFLGILAFGSIFPIMYYGIPRIEKFRDFDYAFGVIVYVLLFNFIVLLYFGYRAMYCMTFPFSSRLYTSSYRK